MRKGFEKLAAEMLVEATIKIQSGNSISHFTVSDDLATRLSSQLSVAKTNTSEKVAPEIKEWIAGLDPSVQKQVTEVIFDNVAAANVLFMSEAGIQQEYTQTNKFLVELSGVTTGGKGSVSNTIGSGELAICFLLGEKPAQQELFDLKLGSAVYSIKSTEGDINTYTYKRLEKKLDTVAKNVNLNNRSHLAEVYARLSPSDPKDQQFKQKVTDAIFEIVFKNTSNLHAIVCKTQVETFSYVSFPITTSLEMVPKQTEVQIKNSILPKQVPARAKRAPPTGADASENLALRSKNLISELSRRDQQEVETIARQVAQEVLEDELGDDFDKAVRREMLVSLKDKEVESGVADVSRDFMRKFYRSLGTASSSPLDKVKV